MLYQLPMCIHVMFMLTQNVTVTVHYLSLCSVSLDLAFVLSVEGLFTLTFQCVGPHSTVGFTCALEWLSAIWVAVIDPCQVLYCLSSIEVLNLGLTLISSEESLSVRDLLSFAGSSLLSAIRLLFFFFLWA